MARQQFKTTGFKEFEDALLELATNSARSAARLALKKAAEPILDAYKAGTTVATGTLVENEAMGAHSKLNTRQKRMTRKPGPTEVEIHIGTADPAGLQEELGIRQQANPALTRAWDQHGGEVALGTIGRELGNAIIRRQKRAAKKAK